MPPPCTASPSGTETSTLLTGPSSTKRLARSSRSPARRGSPAARMRRRSLAEKAVERALSSTNLRSRIKGVPLTLNPGDKGLKAGSVELWVAVDPEDAVEAFARARSPQLVREAVEDLKGNLGRLDRRMADTCRQTLAADRLGDVD